VEEIKNEFRLIDMLFRYETAKKVYVIGNEDFSGIMYRQLTKMEEFKNKIYIV